MEEDIKSDLSSIAFTHPFFSDIVENTLNYIEQLEKENKTLKKYDYRNIKIDKEHKIKSLSFTKEQLDLMNFGIALYLSFDKLFNDEGGEKNF